MPSSKMISRLTKWIIVFCLISLVVYLGNFSNVLNTWISLELASLQLIPIQRIVLEHETLTQQKYQTSLKLEKEKSQIKKACESEKWQDIYRPCNSSSKWSDRIRDKKRRTNVNLTKYELHIKPLGFANSLLVYSRDSVGKPKVYGGDFWRVNIVGRNYSSSFHLVDGLDGSYEGLFVMKEEGYFVLTCYLEYSLCDGVRDPPPDWFRKGTIQGKFQKQEHLGKLDDFINIPTKVIPFTVKRFTTLPLTSHEKSQGCTTTDCGYWSKGNYYTHVQKDKIGFKSDVKSTEKKRALFIYGDSMAKRFYGSVNKTTPVCSELFESCHLSYIWVYKQDGVKDAHIYDGKDFNQSQFLNDIKVDLLNSRMRTNKSYFVINFGLHVMMALPFEKAKNVFQLFLKMLRELRNTYGASNLPNVIWKSTTPPRPEAHEMHIAHLRFLTRQRMYLWNAYTTSEACKANIPVLHVYNMALSSSDGGLDLVHYKDYVFKRAEEQMISYILNT